MMRRTESTEAIDYYKDKSGLTFLLLLVLADLGFFVLHLLWGGGLLTDYLFSIEMDGGYSEMYQYVKEFWIVILFAIVAVKAKNLGYMGWALLFTFVLCDDVLSIHEQGGPIVANALGFAPFRTIRAEDFGEMLVLVSAGVVLISFIGICYVFGGRTLRDVSRDLLILLMMLAFFGVLFDMVHSATKIGRTVRFTLGMFEDGGEMLVMSLILWYVFPLKIHAAPVSFTRSILKSIGLSKGGT